MEKKRGLDFDTVTLSQDGRYLEIVDQTRLPEKLVFLSLRSTSEIREAIYLLQVRGAPAIGVAAAIGLYLAAQEILESGCDSVQAFFEQLKEARDELASARPTAVNLQWALDRMYARAQQAWKEKAPGQSAVAEPGNPADGCGRTGSANAGASADPVPDIIPECEASGEQQIVKELVGILHREALEIRDEDIRVCTKLGEHGLTVLKKGQGILTHCNAGHLATVRYGTATAPIYLGAEQGYGFRVFADETRPLLQGARLTAFELAEAGIDVTLICDNMASTVMKKGWIQTVITGCDRVAANGDAANKIGTSGVAILAKHYGIPFYISAPTSTIDFETATGEDIVIEERPGDEIRTMWYEKPMAPAGAKLFNPSFDVTDHTLITGIITEYGIAYPPYTESLQNIREQMRKDGLSQ